MVKCVIDREDTPNAPSEWQVFFSVQRLTHDIAFAILQAQEEYEGRRQGQEGACIFLDVVEERGARGSSTTAKLGHLSSRRAAAGAKMRSSSSSVAFPVHQQGLLTPLASAEGDRGGGRP